MKMSFRRAAILAAILAAASAAPAGATTFTWVPTAGGLWSTPGNWSPSGPPSTTSDVALFNLNNTYTVTFGISPTIANIDMQNGSVTFALAGHTLTTSNTGSSISDTNLGLTARLTVLDGGVISGGNNIGANPTDTGFLTISTGATWSVSSGLFSVGNNGNGTLTVINGGQLTTSAGSVHVELAIGTTSFGAATVTGAGSAWNNSAIDLVVGWGGSASLTVSSGGSFASSTSVFLANLVGSSGSMTVTGPTSTCTIDSSLTIGTGGTGSVTVSSGATTIVQNAIICASSTATGDLTVTGSGSTFASSGVLTVGSGSTSTSVGTMEISAGATVNSFTAGIAQNSGGIGAVTLSDAGSTWNTSTLAIGGSLGANGGTGTLTINSGATVNVSGATELRNSTNSALTLNGGTLNTGDFTRLGTLNFNNGTIHVSGAFTNGAAAGPLNIDGNSPTALPTLRLSGNVAVNNVTTLTVGNTNQGALVLDSGRAMNLGANNIAIAAGSLSSGSVSVTGAGTTLSTTSTVSVGGTSSTAGGAGVLNIGTGSNLTAATLKIWRTTGTAVNLSGGTLTVTTLDTSTTPSEFNWTGGSLTVNSSLTIDIGTPLGSSLTIPVGGFLTVSPILTNNGTLQMSSNSGIVASTFVNYGLLAGTGNIGGAGGLAVANNGTITPTGLLLINHSAGFANNGTISLATGAILSVATALSNSGTLQLAGGSLTGTTLTNNADGTLQGNGTITGIFTNNGLLLANGGTLHFTNPFTSAGIIQLSDNSANITGGAITNNSSIQGFGKIASNLTNNGSIEALGPNPSIFNITGTITNPPSGSLLASTGNKLLISAGLATNAGLINLTGGTFDNNNHSLNNTGQISGFGVFRTGGSGLDNNGTITFTGGLATVNGNLTNELAQTVNIKYNPAIFTGNITNNGTFKTTATTATFTATFTNNGSYLSDPATNIFSANVAINAGGSMTGSTGDEFHFTGGSLQNSGTFSNGGLLQSSAAVSNAGAFTQSGLQSWSAGAAFTNSAGSANFASDAGSSAASPLSLTITGGTVHLATPQHLHALSLNAGTLDLDLTTPGSTPVDVQLAANNGLTLNGGNLTFTNHPIGLASLGYYKILQYTGTIQGTGPSSIALPAVQNNIAYTLDTTHDPGFLDVHRGFLGDANDDGSVNFADFAVLSNNFGNANATWSTGDFNGDGLTNAADFTLLANNFGNTMGAGELFSADAPLAAPEPSALTFLSVISLALLARRPVQQKRRKDVLC